MAISVGKYNKISDVGVDFDTPRIVTFVPSPTEFDYKKGYIKRYFVQKLNDKDSEIFEISKDNYSSFANATFYLSIFLDWRLTGTPQQIKDSNFKSVQLASKDMPKLMMYLPNYLQFSK